MYNVLRVDFPIYIDRPKFYHKIETLVYVWTKYRGRRDEVNIYSRKL